MAWTSGTAPAGALGGLRVVDLSTSVAGLQATGHLADNGAEVVFVEPPRGSVWRSHPSWPLWSRGKSSVVADLHSAAGSTAVARLIESADVVVDTFRPGVLERFGLDYGALADRAPHLVWGTITGFGPAGRYAKVKAYEGTVMASLGIMQAYSALHAGLKPAFASPWMCSTSAAQVLLHGVLAALYERDSSGLGQLVETSLVEAVASQDLNNFTHLFLRRRYPDAFQDAPFVSPGGVPNSGMAFRTLVAITADGHWLQFGQLSDRLFRAMMRALGLEWMFDDPEWATAPEFEDPSVRMRFWEHMLRAARQKTLAEWQQIFAEDDDIWAEIYRRGPELLSHPQLVHDRRVVEVIGADGRSRPAPGPLVVCDGTPAPVATEAPALGDFPGHFTAPGWFTTAGRSTTTRATDTDADADTDTAPGCPLAGITILELGMYFAGPLGATMLADLGARVIKVEPLDGDPGRNFTGFPEAGGTRTMQGKESIAIDVSRAEGLEIVRRFVAEADVVLQSFRPGVARRLGLDAAALREINPELVYVEAPGYGSTGPCAGKPSFAPTMGAASGFALRNVGDVPTRPDLPLDEVKVHAARLFPATIIVGHADAFAAHAVATAILLGLLARERGHGAQRLETTMLATMAHVLSDQMVGTMDDFRPPPHSYDLVGLSALYRLYDCAEGCVFLAVTNDDEWRDFQRALGPEAPTAGVFADAQGRADNDAKLAGELEKVFLARSADEWQERLLAADVACVRVADVSPAEVLLDNRLDIPGGLTVDVRHPLWDEHPRLKPAVRLSRSRTTTPAGCLAGQHTDVLLREFGFDEHQVSEFHKDDIVR